MRRVREHPWAVAFAAASLLLLLLHLLALDSSPPGLYNDEASIGYNAWAVAHYGVDEHGAHLPLFFEAFGEYKNPVYIYALAPFTWVLPLTPYVVRLPAALFGLATCAAVAMLAWQVTRSRLVAMLALLTAGFTPWLSQESRLGFEVISGVALIAMALWFLARAIERDSRRWSTWSGVMLALSVYGYTTERAFGAAMVAVLCVAFLLPGVPRLRQWLWAIPPLLVAYLVLLVYAVRTPGALTARYDVVGIGFDNPGLAVLVNRFVTNYLTYWGFPFLVTHGDPNIRHNTGFGGELLVVSLPAIVLGMAICVRRFKADPFCRVLVLGMLLAPVPAALTAESTPHSLRAALMLPFLLAFSVYGWQALAGLLSTRRAVALALAAAVCVEAGGYFYDLYVQYPGRALTAFDSGEGAAIQLAARMAGGHEVLLSTSLDVPYIQALFSLRPDPNAFVREGMEVLHMRAEPADAVAQDARPGDLMVLAPSDSLPAGATVVDVERATVGTGTFQVYQPPAQTITLAVVARR
ncbi:MAG TPA: glycosyltransferase family 39 protein [Candidatus Dormibacteraeota bacterium]|nr:glycosyltransferase family 39 protein [Candidatus Dormibacteraeota bacterium]